MLRFLLTRVSLIIPTFIGMTLLAFALIRVVPGDPIETMAGERGIDPARHAALLKEYGLDRPVLVQYGIYIGRVLRGDLGQSLWTKRPAAVDIAARFPVTLTLSLLSIAISLLVALPVGIYGAVKQDSAADYVAR
jgi:dipeptide transport system permease protein